VTRSTEPVEVEACITVFSSVSLSSGIANSQLEQTWHCNIN